MLYSSREFFKIFIFIIVLNVDPVSHPANDRGVG